MAQPRAASSAPARLTRRPEFLAVARGSRAHTPLITLQALPRTELPDAAPRIGLTVTSKTAAAVERNRIRRRLRHALRKLRADVIRPGHDYVIVARRGVLGAGFAHLVGDLESAFLKIHAMRSASAAPRRKKAGDVG